MAPRRPGRRRMGGCETTPPATHTRGRQTPIPPKPEGGSSSLLMIGRRLPASSSFVLACALPGANRLRALQLDPGRAAPQTSSDEESHKNNPTPSPTAKRTGHRARPARLLDNRAPHGWGFFSHEARKRPHCRGTALKRQPRPRREAPEGRAAWCCRARPSTPPGTPVPRLSARRRPIRRGNYWKMSLTAPSPAGRWGARR
jgi:hypothetical protein